ncbi:MAG: (deoxy)nucleoside triphosphate pyrophosphohydrolase [Clostridiaceae bacterium]
MKRKVKVVGAIIENNDNEILCALRSTKMTLPNLWEFPGGKVEENENLHSAIIREINEELDCEIVASDIFHDNVHEYENIIVNLITIKCKITGGNLIAKEHDKLIWLKRENLSSLTWAPADIPAVELLSKEKV